MGSQGKGSGGYLLKLATLYVSSLFKTNERVICYFFSETENTLIYDTNNLWYLI